jgi:methylphosphotriester-DNA--protein-cysteine methyltransferase
MSFWEAQETMHAERKEIKRNALIKKTLPLPGAYEHLAARIKVSIDQCRNMFHAHFGMRIGPYKKALPFLMLA